MEKAVETSNSDSPIPVIGLDPKQRELEAALKEKNTRAADIYASAILVSKNPAITDKIALASHGIRELINLLPTFAEIPVHESDGQTLGNFADALVSAWKKMVDTGRWPGTPPWSQLPDAQVKKVLQRTEILVAGHQAIREGRIFKIKQFLKAQNFSQVPLPSIIEESKAKEWDIYRDFFVKAAHHNSATEDEFIAYLTHFEDLLLNLIKPRTFDTQAELKKIIDEVQNGK